MSDTGDTASGRRTAKRGAVFRTIGEVAEDLDLPTHVLRCWESKFPQLKPLKRGGGRRYYRPEDIALLSRIRQCLYQEGYTIRGVQKLLSEGGAGASSAVAEIAPSLFPLDPEPEAPPTLPKLALPKPTPPRPPRARRASPVAPNKAKAVEVPTMQAQTLSEADRALLEEAAQELRSARQMLDALLLLCRQR